MQSSENTVSRAPNSDARRHMATILSRFPLKSPTVGLIWARAIFGSEEHTSELHSLPTRFTSDQEPRNPRAQCRRPPAHGYDSFEIPAEVTYRGIDLGQCDL